MSRAFVTFAVAVATANGIRVRGASAVIVLGVLIFIVAGAIYVVWRIRGSKKSTERPNESPRSRRGPKDPPPWQ